MGVLRNLQDEKFCQLVVAGKEPADAYLETGGTSTNPPLAASRRMARKIIRKRLEELLDVSARRAQLSRSQILQRIYEDWETSRKLGQMAAAATNAKMMGSELHKMFIERKEVGGPGDFDNKSAEELLEYITRELGELGMDAKDITHKLGIKIEDDNQAVLLPPAKP
jgi:hypothetical protein